MSEAMFGTPMPPAWALRRPKGLVRTLYDFAGAPVRMIIAPDHVSERLGLTSLRAERLAAVLPHLRGRVLDVGAGDNALVRLYRERRPDDDAERSVGVDIHDWGGDCTIIENASMLPFDDGSFDTVCFIACINHIPERRDALAETRRVLRPGGRVLLTMIGPAIGKLGHALWWYSEDKQRDVHDDEEMGMSHGAIDRLLQDAGFDPARRVRFVYGLNMLYVAELPSTGGAT